MPSWGCPCFRTITKNTLVRVDIYVCKCLFFIASMIEENFKIDKSPNMDGLAVMLLSSDVAFSLFAMDV